MKVDVINVGRYKEVIIKESNVTLTTGLLDTNQQSELALQLVECASELVSEDLEEIVGETADAIRDFNSN